MSSTNNSNDNSVALELENLQQQYSNTLLQYKQAVADYISVINNQQENNLVSIQGVAYMGTGSAGESTANTLQDCEAACSSNSSCTGATFVSGKCNIRTGESSIITSSSDSYAIVTQGKQLLMNMEDLNKQLLNINGQITNKMKSAKPIYDDIQQKTDEKFQILIENYKELENERKNIGKLMDQYKTLDTTETGNEVMIKKNYYTYILLFILAVAIIALLVKISMSGTQPIQQTVQYGGQLNNNAYYILFGIVILVIIFNLKSQ